MIPAGTGFWWYRHVQIPADEPPPPPPLEVDLDFVTYDERLAAAARAAGLRVVQPGR